MSDRPAGLRTIGSLPFWLSAAKIDGRWRVTRTTNREIFAHFVTEAAFRLSDLADRFSKGWDDEHDRYRGLAARIVGGIAGVLYNAGCRLTPIYPEAVYRKLLVRTGERR